jgi:hypothetical protein
MKLVWYEDVPATCNQTPNEVELTGVIYEVRRNGCPMVRFEPADKATKKLLAIRRARRGTKFGYVSGNGRG